MFKYKYGVCVMLNQFEIEQKDLGDERAMLYSKHLYELAQDDSSTGRYNLADAIAQSFEQKELRQMEKRLVIKIMMSLIYQAEKDLREALSVRLAIIDNVPAEIITFLANDEISVAQPILQHSAVLNEVDLIYIISSKGPEYWRSIAQRKQLSPSVVRRLTDTGDTDTALNLVDNPHIVLHRNTVKRLIKTSLKSDKLQSSLMRRPEIDAELVVDIYACVSQVLRREISQRFRISPVMVEVALDGLVEELSQEAKGLQQVTPEMMALAKRFKERSEISPVLMLKALKRGQLSFFVALFAEKLNLTSDMALDVIKKEGGKLFAVACRSIGMMKSEFASIYLLSRSARTSEKIVDQRELAEALKYYDTVKDSDVQRIRKQLSENPKDSGKV